MAARMSLNDIAKHPNVACVSIHSARDDDSLGDWNRFLFAQEEGRPLQTPHRSIGSRAGRLAGPQIEAMLKSSDLMLLNVACVFGDNWLGDWNRLLFAQEEIEYVIRYAMLKGSDLMLPVGTHTTLVICLDHTGYSRRERGYRA